MHALKSDYGPEEIIKHQQKVKEHERLLQNGSYSAAKRLDPLTILEMRRESRASNKNGPLTGLRSDLTKAAGSNIDLPRIQGRCNSVMFISETGGSDIASNDDVNEEPYGVN